jgi:glucokinase
MKNRSVKLDLVDRTNSRAVLSCIEVGGKSSRADIAKRLGLSRTTVSTIAGRLIRAGLVGECEADTGGRGRPGIPLTVTGDRWYALGAEYHSRRWIFAVTDLGGKVVENHFRIVKGSGPEGFLDGLAEGIAEVRNKSPGPLLPAVGIGAPGLVDCESGVILRADDLGWRNVPLRERIEGETGLPVFVLNRYRAGGLAEARFGAGRGVHGLVYIGIGTGISAAFVCDGALMHGANYSAGEIGHVIMDPSGPLCGCGKHGCLHALASGTALVRMAAEGPAGKGSMGSLERIIAEGEEISGEAVCREAARGDSFALDCLSRAAAYLGIAVANIITTYNPDKIVLGGPVGHTGEPLLGLVRQEAARWAMDHPLGVVRIETGTLGEYTGALGAACLVLDRKLDLVLGKDRG